MLAVIVTGGNALSTRPGNTAGLAAGLALVATVLVPLGADQAAPAQDCRITGRATSGNMPIPGVSLVALVGDAVAGVTSTNPDGTFSFAIAPAATYRLRIEFTGFTAAARELVVGPPPCDQKIEIELALDRLTAGPAEAAGPATSAGTAGTTRAGGATTGRFETLNVQANASAAAVADATPPPDAAEIATRLLLPPGFSTDGPMQAVAVNGNMAQLDRGLMNDRQAAIGRGEVDPLTGEFRPVGAAGGEVAFGGRGRGGQGPGGGPGQGGRGGPGAGRLGGRGVQQNPYAFTANYTFGGSVLDSAPYQLRPNAPVSQRPYNRNNFGGTVGGPVKIPGLYDGTRRTNFQFNYSGNASSNLFDQYATVPTDAIRNGDFSAVPFDVIDPSTGLPFAGNRIPADRIDPSARTLVQYLPAANLPGLTQNFHYATTTTSSSNNISVRVNHNFSAPPAGRAGGPAGRGGAGARGGGAGGGRGRGALGTNVSMNAQLQYRNNSARQANVFPTIAGRTEGSSLSVPVGLTITHRRDIHTVNVNFSRTASQATNLYAYNVDVAGLAGISGVSTDPFAWGVPTLSFSTFSSLRDITPTQRSDRRLTVSYGFQRPLQNHTLRFGGELSGDRSDSQTDSNPRGTFIYTGLYAAGGGSVPRNQALDFADFLLGLPQQASIQYGPGMVRMRGRAMGLYLQDDWRKNAGLTFNLGLRYDLLLPYQEADGRMVNLDAAPDFTGVAAVMPGETGPWSGAYPGGLVHADVNNIAPKVGVAWRAAPFTVVRGGYAINYNTGSYASVARQLVAQPPFATTSTSQGTLSKPLSMQNPFVQATPTTTTNNYGIDADYVLGIMHTWNADVTRELGVWSVGAGYVGTKGLTLDRLRAPNRGPNGLLIPDVQSFTWQESQGESILAAANFRVRRRVVNGIGFGGAYTLARSRDNTTATGGSATVAQDDRNLDAEWALSNFDRRHQLSLDAMIELPFGPNKPWLSGGGVWAALLEGWTVNTTFTWNSGSPLTPRVSGSASDVARGTNGTLRADYNDVPIAADTPTINRFFNTLAFSQPEAGTFGSALRNMITGPGNRQLDANFSRDLRFGGNRTASLQVTASNLLNLVQWSAVDTTVNSLTFGQVTSVRPMRSMQITVRFRF